MGAKKQWYLHQKGHKSRNVTCKVTNVKKKSSHQNSKKLMFSKSRKQKKKWNQRKRTRDTIRTFLYLQLSAIKWPTRECYTKVKKKFAFLPAVIFKRQNHRVLWCLECTLCNCFYHILTNTKQNIKKKLFMWPLYKINFHLRK